MDLKSITVPLVSQVDYQATGGDRLACGGDLISAGLVCVGLRLFPADSLGSQQVGFSYPLIAPGTSFESDGRFRVCESSRRF